MEDARLMDELPPPPLSLPPPPAPRIAFPVSRHDLYTIEQALFAARGSGEPGARVRLERFYPDGDGEGNDQDHGAWRTVPDAVAAVGDEGNWEIKLNAHAHNNITSDTGTHRIRAVQTWGDSAERDPFRGRPTAVII